MRMLPRLRGPYSFAIVVGLTDGILNALTLAAGHFVNGSRPTFALSLRIAVGSALCGIFVFFTAEYARLRGELLDAEQQLNLATTGRFATTNLGRQVRREAVVSASVSSGANLFGALLPLFLGAVLPGPPILAIAPSLVALGVLGAILSTSIRGRMLPWITVLTLSGVVFSWLGVWLHIA
jgi:VIT1/CCC1 family predicted Fe2+/Mn2+ transporter